LDLPNPIILLIFGCRVCTNVGGGVGGGVGVVTVLAGLHANRSTPSLTQSSLW